VDKGAEVVKRFGLPNPMKKVLPSALGATEEPLLDMTSAYSSFSNEGVRLKPHLIRRVTDADGASISEPKTESYRVITPFVASQMQDMMRGVVTGGTATAIMANKELAKRTICGKTGTVNDFTDAWFLGYTPTYAAGVWIGYPGLKKSLGKGEAGGVAALPMWIRFMEPFLKDKPNDQFPKAPAPDRDILAKRAETSRALLKAQADEAGGAADETSGKAKSVFDETLKPGERGPKSAAQPGETEHGQHQPVLREPRPPADTQRLTQPPPGAPPRRPIPKLQDDGTDREKIKRGKNG